MPILLELLETQCLSAELPNMPESDVFLPRTGTDGFVRAMHRQRDSQR